MMYHARTSKQSVCAAYILSISPDDSETHPDNLGRLRSYLYGIRDAALNLQPALSDYLVEAVCFRGVGHLRGREIFVRGEEL